MRNEMIGAVVRRAIEHPEFRQRLIDDPEGALQAHGFALESDEMSELQHVRGEMSAAPGEDVEQRLVAIAERYGIEPQPDN